MTYYVFSGTLNPTHFTSLRVVTWNVDSLTGRAGELVEALADREVDVGCIQETRWRNLST